MIEKKSSAKYAVRRTGGPTLPKLNTTMSTSSTSKTKKEEKGFSESKDKMKKCAKLTGWEEFDR